MQWCWYALMMCQACCTANQDSLAPSFCSSLFPSSLPSSFSPAWPHLPPLFCNPILKMGLQQRVCYSCLSCPTSFLLSLSLPYVLTLPCSYHSFHLSSLSLLLALNAPLTTRLACLESAMCNHINTARVMLCLTSPRQCKGKPLYGAGLS